MKKKSTKLTTKAGDALPVTRKVAEGMRPMRELAPEMVERFQKERRKRGRPMGRNKSVVSMSLDKDILDMLRAGGAGWQTRVNDLLRAAVGLGS
jgi:uncharacterized protein (DUF4415 family)